MGVKGLLNGQESIVQSVDSIKAQPDGNIPLNALRQSGGKMTGSIDMGNNGIKNVANPVKDSDASNLETTKKLSEQAAQGSWRTASVTLTPENWESDGSQFVDVPGITANNLVIAAPAVGFRIASNANMELYESCGVYLYAQTEGNLQFGYYIEKPTENVYVSIMYMPEVILQ